MKSEYANKSLYNCIQKRKEKKNKIPNILLLINKMLINVIAQKYI